MQEIPLDVIFFTIFTNVSDNRREDICKFMEDTMLEVVRILGDVVRIQNILEKCSELNQIEFVKKVITASRNCIWISNMLSLQKRQSHFEVN